MQVQNKAASPSIEKKSADVKKEVKSEKTNKTTAKEANISKTENTEGKKTDEQTSAYLKVVSRIENTLKKEEGELPEVAVEGFANAVKTRLEDLSDDEKKTIFKLKEIKPLKLEDIEQLPDKIKTSLKDKKSADTILALLKQPKFAELMDSNSKNPPKTYSPKNVAANAQQAKSTGTEKAKDHSGEKKTSKPETTVSNKVAEAGAKTAKASQKNTAKSAA